MKYFGLNENKNTTYQNLHISAKEALGRKFMALNTYVLRRKIYNESSKLPIRKKKEQVKSKVSRKNK